MLYFTGSELKREIMILIFPTSKEMALTSAEKALAC